MCIRDRLYVNGTCKSVDEPCVTPEGAVVDRSRDGPSKRVFAFSGIIVVRLRVGIALSELELGFIPA